MAKPKIVETIQISQDAPFQKKFWKIERFGWVVFAVLLLLLALGFAGGVGPFNYATASNQQMSVTYQPFARRVAPTDIEVTLKQLRGDSAELQIEREFMQKYQIESISPTPSDVTAGNNTLSYEFSVPENATEATVVLSLKPANTSIGTLTGTLSRPNSEILTIKQFVYL